MSFGVLMRKWWNTNEKLIQTSFLFYYMLLRGLRNDMYSLTFKTFNVMSFFFLSFCEACFELRGQSQHRELQERNGSFYPQWANWIELFLLRLGILWFKYPILECVLMRVHILIFSVKALFEDTFAGSIWWLLFFFSACHPLW